MISLSSPPGSFKCFVPLTASLAEHTSDMSEISLGQDGLEIMYDTFALTLHSFVFGASSSLMQRQSGN